MAGEREDIEDGMNEGTESTGDQPSYLGMSDEELLAAEAPSFDAQAPANDDESGEGADPRASQETQEDQGTGGESDDSADTDPTEAAETPEQTQGKTSPTGVAGGEKPSDESAEKGGQQAAGAEKATTEVDYKAAYERLMAPFKANGRDIQVKTVDEAITLMQMGANYNKKMAGLKPNLKLLKMLENNGLLDESKLSFLIDLEKKNPEAINKLVKDSGLDPLDLDPEKAAAYQPKNHAVDDREMALDEVLDEIQGTPTYSKTLALVTQQWDASSKQTVADNPQLLRVINGHMQSGIFDVISTELERERVLGRLNGLSDIEAYRQVGDAIHARGGFNHLGSSQGQAPTTKQIAQPNPKKAEEAKRAEKRRAAAPTKATSPNASLPKDFNPLGLSDEEFEKMAMPAFR